MGRIFLRIYDFLSTHKTICVILLVATIALLSWPLANMRFKEDIADFLPQDEMTKKYSQVFGLSGGQRDAVIIFTAADSSSEATLTSAMTDFSDIWAKNDTSGIYNLRAGNDVRLTMEAMSFIQANYPYFLNKDDYARMDSLLSIPDYANTRMAEIRRYMRKPSAAFAASYLRNDPLLLFSPVLQRLHNLSVGENFKTINGFVLDRSGKYGFLFISSPFGGSETSNNHYLYELCNLCSIQTHERNPEIEITATGTPIISVNNADRIKADSVLAFSLSAILILVLLILALRKASYLFWVAFACAFGFLAALAAMSAIVGGMSVIVLGLASVILGIAVNYPLHYLDHLKHSPDKRAALKEIAGPLLIGNITTVSAFLCLVVLNAAALRDLGIFASVALIGTMMFVIVFLPVLCTYQQKNKDLSQSGETIIDKTKSLLTPQGRHHKAILFVAVTLLTIIFAFIGNGNLFDSDMNNINYMPDSQKRAIALLSNLRLENRNTRQLFIVAEGADVQEALRNNEAMLELVKNDKNIKRINGISDFVFSEQKQKENIQSWESFMQRHPTLKEDFIRACEQNKLNPSLFAPFTNLVDKELECHPASFFAPVDSLTGGHYLLHTADGFMVVNSATADEQSADKTKMAIRNEIGNSGFVFDARDVSSKLVDNLADELDYIGYVCAAVVFVFLCLSFGRLEISLLSFLPLAISWIWITGMMYLFDIRFNIVNIILATFIFGQGDDYTIFITEGLMRRRAYGAKTIKSYQNSIILSAAVMFAGMGMLLLAKHPAMRSLGQVATLGMAVVLFMAFYLPPLVFDFLTIKNGTTRQVPITLKRLGYSIFSLLFFFIISFLLLKPYTFVTFTLTKSTERKRMNLHKMMYGFFNFVIRKVPGVKFKYENTSGEDYSKPSIIICNHQSHLDLMCLLSLNPKIVILTNDWVWKNPLYSHIIHNAEFYPVSDGIEANEARLEDLVRRGYSIAIFPEGTRSADCSIGRFHQGAFYLARKLELDIIPVIIHGAGHVLPKNDFMLREGQITMRICKRFHLSEISKFSDRQNAIQARNWYIKEYDNVCREIETCDYFKPYIEYSNIYKGREIERHCQKELSKFHKYAAASANMEEQDKIAFLNSGSGEFAIAYALSHKKQTIYAYENDTDLRLIAENNSLKPANFVSVAEISEIPADCIAKVKLDKII